VKLAAETTAKLEAVHKIIGRVALCGWTAYRETMIGFYEIDAGTLDAFQRLGRFIITPTTVRLCRS